jgi:putative ABC transport system permease protein
LPIPLFWNRFTLRHARQEWVQTLLLLLILGLGVGTFLSIRMANRAAVEGFQLFTDSLTGTSDWIIEDPAGAIPVSELPKIRDALGNLPAQLFPVIERSLNRPQPDTSMTGPQEPSVRLLGLDLVQIRSVTGTGDDGEDPTAFWDLIDNPEHLLVSKAVAARWDVAEGDSIELILQGRVLPFTIEAILPEFRDGAPLPENLAVMDAAALLQRLPDTGIDRVEVIVPDGALRERIVREAGRLLEAAFSGQWRISAPSTKQVDGAAMTAAFRLNLTVLSLIALLVGLYLIAQTLDATVSRRRKEIATLRSLGIGPGDIYRLWLSEAVLYGLAAGAVGLLVGTAMATLTVEAVTTTVRALYSDTVKTAAGVTAGDVILSFTLGIGGSLIAAWLPARDAAETPPAQFLRIGKRIPPFPVFQHPWIGLAAIILGALLLLLPAWQPRPGVSIPAAGYAAAFFWLTGGTLVAAGSLKWIGMLLYWVARDNAPARLAGSRLREPTSRHQLALSGFFVAIGMAAAMAFLIKSFEFTVTGWLEHRLRADLFVSSVGFQGSDTDQRMEGALLDAIEATPGVAAMDRFRGIQLRIDNVATTLAGTRFALLGNRQDLLWIKGPLDTTLRPPEADATGYANENLVRRAGLSVGDTVVIETPSGPRSIWIGGLHADYSRDNGLLVIDLPVLESWYQVFEYDTASIFLEPGVDPAILQDTLRAAYLGLAIRQNGELKKAALFIFNQTFAVTRALQVIGLVVALAGLTLSLLSLLRESGRELTLQRTLGMSRREIAFSTALEGMGIALTGLISGLILSVALGYVLIFVINRQSFGWTLQVNWPWQDVAGLAVSVLILGLAISYTTGWLFLRRWKQEAL